MKGVQDERMDIDDTINLLGFGKFSCLIMCLGGVLYFGDGAEMNLIALIAPQLRCVWNLSSIQISLMSSAVFVGASIGSIYSGFIGDKHGRKLVAVGGTFMCVYFGLLNSVSMSYNTFLLSRFFVGFGLGSVGPALTLVTEFIPKMYRGRCFMAEAMFYSSGSIYVAIFALLVMQTSWRMFLIVCTLPCVLFLVMSPWLPESVRYLQNTGKYDQVLKILKRISESHETILPPFDTKFVDTSKRGDIKILLSKRYCWKLVILATLFISTYYGYYGVVMLNTELLQSGDSCRLNTSATNIMTCNELKNSDYIQNILVALAELPGMLLPMFAVDVIGRKGYLVPALIFSSACFLCLNICISRTYVTILMWISRLILSGAAQLPIILTVEHFPTVVRTSALGILLGITKCSLIGVSFLAQSLLHYSLLITTLVFGGLCFISAILILFLPETKKKSLVNL